MMTNFDRQNGKAGDADALLVAHIATGKTVRDAAAAVGVSEATAYRRMGDAAFRERVSNARTAVAAAVLLRCVDLSAAAMTTLEELLDAGQPPAVRLGAARAVLTVASDFGEKAELRERIEALEAVLSARPKVAA